LEKFIKIFQKETSVPIVYYYVFRGARIKANKGDEYILGCGKKKKNVIHGGIWFYLVYRPICLYPCPG
jgi:hypothetical protein